MSELLFNIGFFSIVFLTWDITDKLEIKNKFLAKYQTEIETTCSLLMFMPLFFLLVSAYYPAPLEWLTVGWGNVILFLLMLLALAVVFFSLDVIERKGYVIRLIRKKELDENVANTENT